MLDFIARKARVADAPGSLSLVGPKVRGTTSALEAATNHALDATLFGCFLIHAFLVLSTPLAYIPDDGLFYYQIGFNFSHGMGVRFNDAIPTNGFHPLWLLVCSALGVFANTKQELLTIATACVVVLNGAGAFLLRAFVKRHFSFALASGAVLIGAPYLFFVPVGMEASLSFFIFAVLVSLAPRCLTEFKFSTLCVTAALAGLLVASRLDLAILAGPLAALLAFRFLQHSGYSNEARLQVALAAMVGMAPVMPFLLVNWWRYGDPRPISGILKLISTQNGVRTLKPGGFISLCLGLLTAATIVGWIATLAWVEIVAALWLGELAFLAYLVLFNASETSPWYFALFAATGAIACASLTDAFMRWLPGRRAWGMRLLPVACVALGVASAVAGTTLMLRFGRQSDPGASIGEYSLPGGLADVARRAGVRRVLTFDRPGELAYLDGFSVFAADGLTTNLRFQKELAARGIHWLIKEFAIDAIVLPSTDGGYGAEMCGRLYLGAMRLRCSAGSHVITDVDVISRLTGEALGTIHLAGAERLRFSPARKLEVVLLQREPRVGGPTTADGSGTNRG